MPEIDHLAAELAKTLLVGAEHAVVKNGEIVEYTNGAFLVWPDGTLQEDWGGKVYLVPFTEALPFRGLLGRFVEGRGGEVETLTGVQRPRSYTSHAMTQYAYEPALAPGSGAQYPLGVVTPQNKNDLWWRMSWMRRESFFLPRYDDEGNAIPLTDGDGSARFYAVGTAVLQNGEPLEYAGGEPALFLGNEPLVWLAPTIIGIPISTWLIRSYRKDYDARRAQAQARAATAAA